MMSEAARESTEAQVKKAAPPFFFNEAPVPEGFPSATPVGEIMVKRYPAYRAATTTSQATQNRMFGVLFQHIKQENIAMTAPVEMTYDASMDLGEPSEAVSMAFLYRMPTQGTAGAAAQPGVDVIDVPAMHVATLGVRGSYRKERIAKAFETLQAWLEANADTYEIAGPPRFMGYNSPFVPGLVKYGEAQWPVRVLGEGSSGEAEARR